jgi:CBS domain-containing protein
MMTMESSSHPSAVDGAVEPMLAWLETPLGEFMIRNPLTAHESEPVRAVRARMIHSGAGYLPILSGGRPVGM